MFIIMKISFLHPIKRMSSPPDGIRFFIRRKKNMFL